MIRWYVQQSPKRRGMVLLGLWLAQFGLLITVSIRMQDPVSYFMVCGMVLLGMIYGTLRVSSMWLHALTREAGMYRLAWLSARRRAHNARSALMLVAYNDRHTPN